MKRPDDITIERVLNEKATKTEAREVAEWLATDNGQKWLSVRMDKAARDIIEGTLPLDTHIPSDEIFSKIERCIAKKRRRNVWIGVAAAIVPCLMVAAMWADLSNKVGGDILAKAETVEVNASFGERKQVVFQDGTIVYLNAGSKITYPLHFNLGKRRVSLDGEAYFEVEPNHRRPFIIETGETAQIKVTGTSLDVRSYRNEPTVNVVLINGKVEFWNGKQSYLMQPSEKLTFNKKSGRVSITTEESPVRGSLWKDNIILFRDAPLSEVIETLGRWYNVSFEVQTPEAYSSRFSLKTKEMPLENLLDEMQHISNLSFTLLGDKVIVSSK